MIIEQSIIKLILLLIAIAIVYIVAGHIDVNPQWMNMTRVTFNGTTYAEAETNTPNAVAGDMVMEIFKVVFEIGEAVIASVGAASGDSSIVYIAALVSRTQGAVMPNLNDADVIIRWKLMQETQFAEATETGGAGMMGSMTCVFDLSDNNGHGLLVAAESLFLGVLGSSALIDNSLDCKILYKAKKVNASELLQLARQ